MLVKIILHGDVRQFSIAIGSFGIGGLIGAIALLFVDAERDRRPFIAFCAASFGVITVRAAINPWLWALPLLLTDAGTAMSVANTSANALLQASAPFQLRGQTVSLFMRAMRGGTSLGALLTGLSVNLFGIRYALAINGALAALGIIIIARQWLRATPMQDNNTKL